MSLIPRIAITAGEPAGIGPDLLIQLAQQSWPAELVVFSDKTVLLERATQLKLPLTLNAYQPQAAAQAQKAQSLTLAHVPLQAQVKAGQLNVANGSYVLTTLQQATQAVQSNTCQALVTGPVHKGIINDAGIPFSGHTEFLAELTHTKQVVMMLASPNLRVALVTTHIPLSQVPKAITKQRLEQVITVLYQDLQTKFGISKPCILVCGLNPHAGENGHLGHEEIDIITPTLKFLIEEKGFDLRGPYPADTLFQPKYLEQADAVLAMYHDQGLPVLKYQGFGASINITLGLPILRTSVDHGTAIDLAGTGQANPSSFIHALKEAIQLTKKL